MYLSSGAAATGKVINVVNLAMVDVDNAGVFDGVRVNFAALRRIDNPLGYRDFSNLSIRINFKQYIWKFIHVDLQWGIKFNS